MCSSDLLDALFLRIAWTLRSSERADLPMRTFRLSINYLALLFGASRVGALGGALGRGIREFRQEASEPEDGKSSPAMTSEQSEALAALTRLRDQGVLTAEEFEAKKAELQTSKTS